MLEIEDTPTEQLQPRQAGQLDKRERLNIYYGVVVFDSQSE